MESYINSLLGADDDKEQKQAAESRVDDVTSDNNTHEKPDVRKELKNFGESGAVQLDAGTQAVETQVEESDVADDSVVSETNDLSPLLPFTFAKRVGVFVLASGDEKTQKKVTLYHTDPINLGVIAEIRRYLKTSFSIARLDKAEFESLMTKSYESRNNGAMQMVEDLGDEMDLARLADSVPESDDLLEQEDDAPIIRLINALLTEAVKEGASDIHIETFEKRLVVRYRVDGVLREVVEPKRALAPLLVSRIKVMAKLDIAEKRIPQDGRISIRIGGREIDLRVSTMPSSNGERVVMRLLDKQAGRLDLSVLGMVDSDLRRFKQVLHRPHGIVLVTGPTGSGKTTSLYAGLTELNEASRNILTVEDPIEYNLEGIGQTQVNNKADMTFAKGLRAMLRQDPDVVMVGEIRDGETADIAVQASLTGHLVLSTLHTNTAVGAVTRMYDMGVEPFLLSSSLVGVVAQRLVRVLCDSCKQPYEPSVSECELLGIEPDSGHTIYQAGGCKHCNQLGYRGRRGIYEIIVVTNELRKMIHDQAAEDLIVEEARKDGPSIFEDGAAKVLAGVTTLEEVLRVTHDS